MLLMHLCRAADCFFQKTFPKLALRDRLYIFDIFYRAVGGSLTNVSSSPAITVSPSPNKPTYTRVQSVWVKADKGDRSTPMKGLQTKVNKKLTNKRASQVSNASSSDSPDSSNRNSLEHPIELNEQVNIASLDIFYI
jgi:hypothetical protein